MKICIFSSCSFEINYSSYHLMRDLIEALLNDGNEVLLIQKCFKRSGVLPQELQGRQSLKTVSVPAAEIDKANLIKRMLKEIQYGIRAMSQIRKAKDCDVFFMQSNYIPWLGIGAVRALTGKKIIYNIQDIFPQDALCSGVITERNPVYKILIKLQRWALRHSDKIITISQDMKKTLCGNGADPNKIYVVHNWKNEVRELAEDDKAPSDGKYHVVYAGNIGRLQNVEAVVRTAALLKNQEDIQFDIYGTGIRLVSCKQAAEELKASNLVFHDPLPANQAHCLYENADLNLIPLAKNVIRTALPSKTAVCVSSGKPVVFCVDTDSEFAAAMKDLGIPVADVDDDQALADAILKAKSTPMDHSAYQKAAELFDKESSLAEYLHIIQK